MSVIVTGIRTHVACSVRLERNLYQKLPGGRKLPPALPWDYIALATGPADAYKTLGQTLCKEVYHGYNPVLRSCHVQWQRQ